MDRREMLARMQAILDGAKGRSLTEAERNEFDSLETKLAIANAPDVRGCAGSGPAVTADGHTLLRPEQRYADWLNEKLSHGGLKDRRSVATDFDTRKYWIGMATGTWKNADAEQRASMQEGVNADGGYLVPVPVAGQWVDLLRDQLVFLQGNAHTVPWESGSTLTLPVMVTDPVVQNPNETSDVYPPGSDATVGRYVFTARPYTLLEVSIRNSCDGVLASTRAVVCETLARGA